MDFNFSSGLSRPGTAVFDSGVPLGTLYENPIENMQLKGIIHTESATIDIEDANPSSSEIVSAKATGNPNLTRLLSRKSSFREDRKINDCAAEGGKGSEYIAKDYGVDKYDIGTGFGHFAIATEDIYKLVEDIKAKGGNVTREPGPVKGGTTVIAFVQDPDGYMFEIIQRCITPEPIC